MENNNNLSLKSLSSDEINKIEEFRKSKHTAVLAILFSDIVNSTYATEKLGEQTYSKLRHIHDELFKKIMCRDNAGIIIKEIGDSFLCVFAEPSTAVLRAVEFQRAIHSNKENLTVQDYTLTVKIGIHVGQVAVENSLALDIFGRHVNRAARIETIANGGQILTSLAIWENAVGWLKDNNEDKIGWISYGKTKIKGVEEKVDIFGFYPKEIGKPSAPKKFRNQKRNHALRFSIVFAVIAVLAVFIIWKSKNEITVLTDISKSYYVQFDFSEFAKQSDGKLILDTLDISEKLLSQAISILSPDSVITESDMIKSFSKKGELYHRHSNSDTYDIDDSGSDDKYFRDSLKLDGVVLFKLAPTSNEQSDSLKINFRMVSFTSSHEAVSRMSWGKSNLKNIEDDFRKFVLGALMGVRLRFVQGYVLSSNNNTVIIRLSKGAKLREGASIGFSRQYAGKEGLQKRLEYLKEKINYFKNTLVDSTELKENIAEFAEVEKDILQIEPTDTSGFGLEIKAKVTELYDTTCKATWTLNGKFPNEKLQYGDVIYLAH